MRVCILTPSQAFQLEANGITPCCRDHHHLSRSRAEELIAQHFVYLDDQGNYARMAEARWVGKRRRYMTFVRSREWKRLESAGLVVMQLVPAGGVW